MVTRSIINYEQHKEDIREIIVDKYGDRKANKFLEHYGDRFDIHCRSFIDYKLAYRLMDDYHYCKKVGTRWYAFVGVGGTGKSTLAKNVFYFLDKKFSLKHSGTEMKDFIEIIGGFKEEDKLRSAYLDEPDDSIASHSQDGKKVRQIFGKIRQQQLFLGICATDLTDIPKYIFNKLDGIFFTPCLGKGMFFKNRPRKKSYILQEIRKQYQYKGYKVFFQLQKQDGCLLFDTQKATPLDNQEKEYLKSKREDYEKNINEFLTQKANPISERDKIILNMRKNGKTHEQIATDIGIHRTTVSKILGKLDDVNV